MPESIQHTPGATVRASEINAIANKARCETVTLPYHAMHAWRNGLVQFKKQRHEFQDLEGDYDDASCQYDMPKLTDPTAAYAVLGGAVAAASDETTIVSTHLLTGQTRFVRKDTTGALSADAVVPEIIRDECDEDAEALRLHGITEHQMTDAEKTAYRQLEAEWKKLGPSDRAPAVAAHVVEAEYDDDDELMEMLR